MSYETRTTPSSATEAFDCSHDRIKQSPRKNMRTFDFNPLPCAKIVEVSVAGIKANAFYVIFFFFVTLYALLLTSPKIMKISLACYKAAFFLNI